MVSAEFIPYDPWRASQLMTFIPESDTSIGSNETLSERFHRIRRQTLALCRTLRPEDTVVQSMPDASPTKWHLAHTTWFFEQFLLGQDPDYQPLHPGWAFLFNSYYESVGPIHLRPMRGMFTRPGWDELVNYRAQVDERMQTLLIGMDDPERVKLTILGLHHEQQHQELLLTDIKHLFSLNPLEPAFDESLPEFTEGMANELKFIPGRQGGVEIGHAGDGFAFDNEGSRHTQWLQPHALGQRLISNAEYREFIDDGGYHNSLLWLSAGWHRVQEQGWQHPLYWADDLQSEFTLAGRRDLGGYLPVCHISYFEADAFTRWAGARLATEAEWESMAAGLDNCSGNFQESGHLHPCAAVPGVGAQQMFGDVWEWTSSAYLNYPGFRPPPGALGEYNGKFMCGQWVLRGGSCVTPGDHIRATYRNFFYPPDRWQFSGLRLAKDL